MKKIVIHILVVIIFGFLGYFFGKGAIAQEANPNALLWKIEGNNIQTSYIYGTFHLINKDDFNISEPLKEAFKNSNQLVLELDFDDPDLKSQMMENVKMEEGKTLSGMMTEQQAALVDEALKEKYHFGLKVFDQMKPFFVASMLIPTLMDKKVKSYEEELAKMAKKQKIEVLGLETVAEQMKVFDDLPLQGQVDDLVELVEEKEKSKQLFEEMISFYHAQNIDGLVGIFDSYYTTEEEKSLLLTNRNLEWKNRIPAVAAEKSSFIAVGAAHLGGEFGIINLLKEEGYSVTPIL